MKKRKKALTQQEIKKIKKQLYYLRDEMLSTVKKNKENNSFSVEVGDSIDFATDSSAKEMLFELTDAERNILRQIEDALKKLDKKTYGICERCGKSITKKRLRIKPYAKYCIKCKTVLEKI